jgi:hypothetical protein
MTDKAISPLRQRMIEDMTIRKFAANGRRGRGGGLRLQGSRRRRDLPAARSSAASANEDCERDSR